MSALSCDVLAHCSKVGDYHVITHYFSVLSGFVKLEMTRPPNHGGTKAILRIGLSSRSPLNFWKCISNMK